MGLNTVEYRGEPRYPPCITLILSRPVSVCLELITPPSGLHYLREQICHRISSPLSLSGSYRFTGLTSSTTCPYSSVFLLDDPCLRLDSHRTPFPHAARPCNKFYLVIRRKLLCFTCEHGLGQKTTPFTLSQHSRNHIFLRHNPFDLRLGIKLSVSMIHRM